MSEAEAGKINIVAFMMSIDVDVEWKELGEILADPYVGSTVPEDVKFTAIKGPPDAFRAALLATRLKVDAKRVEEEVEHDLGTHRRAALAHLEAEKAAGRIHKVITEAMVDWTAREAAPEQWARLRERAARAVAAREAAEALRDAMHERCRTLRAELEAAARR